MSGKNGYVETERGELNDVPRFKAGSSKGRALAPFLAFVLFGFAIHLLVHQLNIVSLSGFPLGFYMAAQGAPILLATIAFWIASRRMRDEPFGETGRINEGSRLHTGRAVVSGLTLSGEVLSGAVVVGLTGIAFAQGYDGLAYTLGLMCALIAMSLFVVPAIAQTRSRSLSMHLFARYRSRSVSILGALILAICLLLLLAAEITAVAIVISRVFGVGFEHGIAVAGVLTILAAGIALLGRRVLTVGLALSSIALLIVLTVMSGLSSMSNLGIALPQFGFGGAIAEIVGLERSMLESGVADAVSLKQHVRPRLHFDAVNFFAIVGCICFGIAVFPFRSLYRGGFGGAASAVTGTGFEARDGCTSISLVLAWCAFFVCLTLVTIPAVAALAKLDLYRALAAGIPLTALPGWAAPFALGELLAICGESELSASNLASACTDGAGQLRLQDVALQRDATLLAVPEIGIQPAVLIWGLAGIICFCGLVAGARLFVIARNEFADSACAIFSPAFSEMNEQGAFTWRAGVLPLALILVGALVGATSGVGIVTLVAWSACLSASTLFPVVVLGHLWSRIGPVAVSAAMIAGAGVCAYYVIGTTYFATSFASAWHSISSAPEWQLEQMASLREKCDAVGALGRVFDCASLAVLSRESANWFGIQNTASALFAMPVAIFVLGIFGLAGAIIPSSPSKS